MPEHAANPISCRELVELVTEYFAGALSNRDRLRFDDHLRGCASCLAYLAQMRKTLVVVGQIHEEDVPLEAQTALLAAFRRWKAV